MPTTAYIGLGANLGDKVAALHAAIAEIDRRLGTVLAISPFYLTEPRYDAAQDPFLNAVVACRTDTSPVATLGTLLAIEQDLGRVRDAARPKGPRVIDLDLLLHGDTCLHTPSLTLPHPAIAERRFVLQPLAELAPALVHPRLQATIAALLLACPDQGRVVASAQTRNPSIDAFDLSRETRP